MGVYELTFDEWDACRRGDGCTRNPDDSGWGRGRRPVIDVSWADAQEYVRWLSRETGESYRLLSESEWEYMARAGTTGPFHFGATISTTQANYDGSLYIRVWPQGSVPTANGARRLVSSQCVRCARCAWKRVGVGGGLLA